ncbi:MAG: D-tyrosyl-tRNA(Tyr) deacylase [Oligoflexia bacterium]|nr:D-tyrosyl-tRNA(Tyr) deacylase [Oligoflexia bacterium]
MKIVIQRSKKSNVIVDNKVVGEIERGMVLLVCMEKGDDLSSVEKAAKKILGLRIFSDEQGKMNLSLKQVEGDVLAISQFTLSWDGVKGNRPSFDRSMPPNEANELFESFCDLLIKQEVKVEKGVFGASMEVNIQNDGPVTFSLDF